MSEWMIFENSVFGWLSPADREASLRLGHSAAPTIESREELERFIGDLRLTAERVFSESVKRDWGPRIQGHDGRGATTPTEPAGE